MSHDYSTVKVWTALSSATVPCPSVHAVMAAEGAVIVSVKPWPARRPLVMVPVKVLVKAAPATLETRFAVTWLLLPLFQLIFQLTVPADRSCRQERLVTLLSWCVPLVTVLAAPVPMQPVYFWSMVRVVFAGVYEIGGL
ncbi:hypothetical protein [Streptomyces bauhiniae]